MPDFDANDDPNRLRLTVARPAIRPVSISSIGASTKTGRPTSAQHEIAPRGSAAGPGAAQGPARALRRLGLLVVRYLDVVFVVLAAPFALALGAPAFGVLVGAGAWLLQRLVALADRRVIVRAAEPGSRLGLDFIDAFVRIWLLAAGIIVAGAVGSNHDGLAAALVILGAYSIAFAVRIARGREAGPS